MKLKVLEYNKGQDVHRCEVDNGAQPNMLLDIMVDGGFQGQSPESLVGKTFTCSYTHPYISIAHDVLPYASPSADVSVANDEQQGGKE